MWSDEQQPASETKRLLGTDVGRRVRVLYSGSSFDNVEIGARRRLRHDRERAPRCWLLHVAYSNYFGSRDKSRIKLRHLGAKDLVTRVKKSKSRATSPSANRGFVLTDMLLNRLRVEDGSGQFAKKQRAELRALSQTNFSTWLLIIAGHQRWQSDRTKDEAARVTRRGARVGAHRGEHRRWQLK